MFRQIQWDRFDGFSIKEYLDRTLPSVVPNYGFLKDLEKATAELQRQMNITFPVTYRNSRSDLIGTITNGFIAVATVPVKVAEKAIDGAGDLVGRLNPLGGISDGLDSFFGVIWTIMQIVFIVGLVACCGYCLFQAFTIARGFNTGSTIRYANLAMHYPPTNGNNL